MLTKILKKRIILTTAVLFALSLMYILPKEKLYTLDKVDQILYIINNDPVTLKNMKSLITIFNNLNITNYKILLNNSANPFKRYFSLFDIKNIIKNNIDYENNKIKN